MRAAFYSQQGPARAKRLPLSDIAEAYNLIEAGRIIGNIVLDISS